MVFEPCFLSPFTPPGGNKKHGPNFLCELRSEVLTIVNLVNKQTFLNKASDRGLTDFFHGGGN